jgi:hypothetical protein
MSFRTIQHHGLFSLRLLSVVAVIIIITIATFRRRLIAMPLNAMPPMRPTHTYAHYMAMTMAGKQAGSSSRGKG